MTHTSVVETCPGVEMANLAKKKSNMPTTKSTFALKRWVKMPSNSDRNGKKLVEKRQRHIAKHRRNMEASLKNAVEVLQY